MEGEKLIFVFENIGRLKSLYQRIQYDSANKWKTKRCETERPQHHIAIEKVDLNWISFFKLEP